MLERDRVLQLIFATLFRSTGLFVIKLSIQGVTVKCMISDEYPTFIVWIGQFLYLSHK